MFIKNGIWDQMDKLSTCSKFKPLTLDTLAEALMKVSSKTSNTTDYCIHTNAEISDYLWDLIYGDKLIKVYGIKLINIEHGMYIYEGVLFDKFPDNYDLLFIERKIEFKCVIEEIEVVELTDTKIIFKCSFLFPEHENNITLQWN